MKSMKGMQCMNELINWCCVNIQNYFGSNRIVNWQLGINE